MLKVEKGKYYRARDGRKIGPMDGNMFHWVKGFTGVNDPEWITGGRHMECLGMTEADDLIAEWFEDTDPKLSGETIDSIAIDSLKYHFKDDDLEPLQKEAFRIVLRYYGVSV